MLTLNDGRSELWQWDTGRTLAVDADCSQVHFSNKVFGRSIDVDVTDGVAIIPDILLQTDNDLNVWAFVGTADNGYTKISKTFKVNRRNKPADYVFTPTEQMTLQMIQIQIGDLADLTTEAKDTLVAAINEAARTGGGAGSMDLRVADGYVQYSADGGMTWTNLIAIADLKGDPGEPGKDGHSPVVTATKSGKTTTISVDGAAIATVEDGADGKPGTAGADGITPTIGSNGNWYLGDTDTGKPSRGETGPAGADGRDGADGQPGSDGKSAYAYAVEGGYTGTEAEFAAKLAKEKFANPYSLTFAGAVTGSYDGSEAVTVEIPSGGGSGEIDLSVLGWKTYQTITVSGDNISSVKFTDFTVAFKECGFLQKSVAGTSIGLQYKINGKQIADNVFYNFQAAERYSEIFFTCAGIDGKYCVEFNLEHTSGSNAGDVYQLIRSTVPVQTINSVEVFPRTTGKYFADGCEFTLVYR